MNLCSSNPEVHSVFQLISKRTEISVVGLIKASPSINRDEGLFVSHRSNPLLSPFGETEQILLQSNCISITILVILLNNVLAVGEPWDLLSTYRQSSALDHSTTETPSFQFYRLIVKRVNC